MGEEAADREIFADVMSAYHLLSLRLGDHDASMYAVPTTMPAGYPAGIVVGTNRTYAMPDVVIHSGTAAIPKLRQIRTITC